MPTITATEFSRLNEARRLQIERYRTAYFKREGSLPSDTDPAIDREWLRVRMGQMDCCIPVNTLTKWANTFGESMALSFDLDPILHLLISRGTSKLRVYTKQVEYTDKGIAFVSGNTTPLEDPITLTVNGKGLVELSIPDVSAELSTLRAETTAARKQLAKEKAIAKAKKAEKQALERLTRETTQANEAQAVMDSMTLPQAIQFAKRCLNARRMLRFNLSNLDVLPTWLPKTYQHEFFNCETQNGDIETRNTLNDWREHLSDLTQAIEARKAYKPRASWPSWMQYMSEKELGGKSLAAYKKAHPELASHVYGPAYDKLKEEEKKASDNLVRFLGHRFREYCETQGLPGQDIATDWFYVQSKGISAYSHARRLLSTWEQRRTDLESQLREAKAHTEAVSA